jgi:hypothetical protein
MFELDRTFSQHSATTGLTEWYFSAREGVYGPYKTRKIALEALNTFIGRRKLDKDDGGRDSGKAKLTILPLEFSLEPMSLDYSKRKKGIDD